MTDVLAQAEAVAAWLCQHDHKKSPAVIRQLAEVARQQHQIIQNQRQEIIDMARTFEQATGVVIDQVNSLKQQLFDAQGKTPTQATLDAQQKIVDLAEALSPSPAPTDQQP